MRSRTQSLNSSGGKKHIAMVKAACMKAIHRFDSLTQFTVRFEEHWEIGIQFTDDNFTGYTNVRGLRFRPDFILRHRPEREERTNYNDPPIWKGLEWSNQIVFEVETNPYKIFNNDRLKLEYYDRIRKEKNIGRQGWAFVLVVMDDAKLPPDTSPFDEVWKLKEDELSPFQVYEEAS